MEKLSTGDWSLIARYLSEEANEKDLVRLTALAERTKDLRAELKVLRQRMEATMPVAIDADVFDADVAFDKLEQRLKSDGLI